MEFIDLKAQYEKYKNEISQEINSCLEKSSFIMGPKILELESKLAKFLNVKHAIACSSGTDALLLCLLALDIKAGDEIITSPFTFVSTIEVISLLNAIPVFVDIDPETFNINPTEIEKKITPKTKAIIPVSLFGQVADMDEINEIAEKYKISVIEDAAQSFGATYKDKKSCTLSDLACTSFFPAKPLGCYGDGGAVFTNDDDLAKSIRVLLNHGQSKKYEYQKVGINGRLDAIQAAILIVKLKYYDNEIAIRQIIAAEYSAKLIDFKIPVIKSHNKSVWAQYCLLSSKRDEIVSACEKNGIPTMIYYPTPLHLQPAYLYLGYSLGDFPVSEKISNEIFAIPMSAFLSKIDQDKIISILVNFDN